MSKDELVEYLISYLELAELLGFFMEEEVDEIEDFKQAYYKILSEEKEKRNEEEKEEN